MSPSLPRDLEQAEFNAAVAAVDAAIAATSDDDRPLTPGAGLDDNSPHRAAIRRAHCPIARNAWCLFCCHQRLQNMPPCCRCSHAATSA
uniref:Uncharacterized protein n=1 Tax=Romanomermis culicivorax TaxID=13658 RepID=A0A915KM96_ROMCU